MRIFLRPSMLTIRRRSFRWIIIHHTFEIYKWPETRVDNSSYQMTGIFNGALEQNHPDINYHYVIEKVKEDYIPIACRPISHLCEWDDIHPDINNRAFHVALLGNYDIKIPEKRLYDILAYRLLNPIMKIYHLTPSRIKLHSEVTNIKDLTCPGEFVNKNIIIAMTRKFVVR
jgi:hypothetical protein